MQRERDNIGFYFVTLVFIITTIIARAAGGCLVDEGQAVQVLHESGMVEIRMSSSPVWFECGEDPFGSKFSATRDGQPVAGMVCCGFAKACTVRF